MNEILIVLYIAISALLSVLFITNFFLKKSFSSLISATIVFWSGLVYTNHFFGFVSLTNMYYLDWVLTTPLLVLLLANATNNRFSVRVFLTVIAQFFVVVTGFLASNTVYSGLFFFVGLLLFVFVLYNILFFARNSSSKGFLFLTIFLLTWVAYPVVWWVVRGDLSLATLPLLLVPFVSKHVFTFLKEFWL